MNRTLFFGGSLTLVMGLAGLSSAFPDWPHHLGVNFWDLSQVNEQVKEMNQVDDELTAASKTVSRRIDLKHAVCRELIAGRIEFRTAVAQFANLNINSPHIPIMIGLKYPGTMKEDADALNLVDFLCETSAQEDETRDRRMAEYEIWKLNRR